MRGMRAPGPVPEEPSSTSSGGDREEADVEYTPAVGIGIAEKMISSVNRLSIGRAKFFCTSVMAKTKCSHEPWPMAEQSLTQRSTWKASDALPVNPAHCHPCHCPLLTSSVVLTVQELQSRFIVVVVCFVVPHLRCPQSSL